MHTHPPHRHVNINTYDPHFLTSVPCATYKGLVCFAEEKKVKLYTDANGHFKGDGLCCFLKVGALTGLRLQDTVCLHVGKRCISLEVFVVVKS